jgi:hypothetical protein
MIECFLFPGVDQVGASGSRLRSCGEINAARVSGRLSS